MAIGLIGGTLAGADDPTKMEFKLIAAQRFVLDNELVVSEFVPGASARPSLQNPLMPFGKMKKPKVGYGGGRVTLKAGFEPAEGALFVGGFLPGLHYSVDFDELSPGAAAELVFAPYDGSLVCTVRAEPGKKVSFSEVLNGTPLKPLVEKPEVVPPPPFRLSGVVAGPTLLICVRKENTVKYLGAVTFAPEPDIRRKDFAGKLKFAAGADLPAGGTAVISRATAAITAGVGQADFRIVTEGPTCVPYTENGRMFCTFSARAGKKYVKSVGSFDPALFNFRIEGILFTDYGDDDPILRNDAVNHLFHDRDGSWKAVGCGWSVAANNLDPKTRVGSGLLVMETPTNPLHGVHVLRARQLVVGKLKSEDPYFDFDAASGKWRLATSTFTDKGLRACVWEAEKWDGPYNKLVGGPVKFDSTGCQVMDFGGSKYVMTANMQQRRPVYDYPALAYVGEWRADFYPFNRECKNGRIFTAFARTPPGCPYKYIMLTMDRQNFPGMPLPNWTYGGMYFYGANP